MNFKSFKKSFLILPIIFLIGCDVLPNEQIAIVGGGVAITFDDDFIDDWYNIHNMLKEYNWRATFFVSGFHKLDSNKIEKLKILKEYGHEIGGHGLNHLIAPNYVRDYGLTAYLENEIYPMKQLMAEKGFNITSFAYPQSVKNDEIDAALLNEFKVIRGGTSIGKKTVMERRIKFLTCRRCFHNVLYGLGFDNSVGLEMSFIKSLIEKAKKKDKAVILLSHEVVETVDKIYQTDYQRLIELCEFINENNMKFLLISELYKE